MKSSGLIFIVISLLMGIIIYISTEHIILTIAVFLIFLLFSLVFISPMLKNFNKVIFRYHQCYHFINNFIISLSIKKSIAASLENTSLSMDEDFLKMYGKLEDMGAEKRLNYLNGHYFPFHVYRLFLQVLSIYQEQGGDILDMSKYLLEQCRYQEEYVSTSESLAKRKYVEMGILWIISLSILVLLRFALNDFYTSIKSQAFYLIAIGVLSIFVLVSIYFAVYQGTKVDLKGYQRNEKIV